VSAKANATHHANEKWWQSWSGMAATPQARALFTLFEGTQALHISYRD
jgi:hypothetical protein